MADNAKPEVAETKPKSKKIMTLIVIGGVMLAEAGLIIGAMKMFGSEPEPAMAADGEGGEGGVDGEGAGDATALAEVCLAEVDASNNRTGRQYMYHLQVFALIEAEQKEALDKIIEERRATIQDRINTIIRAADPKQLNEPGLETLRRQVKFELQKIIGEGAIIHELLIPELLQSRSSL